jgi:nanoRNase/pAp phosphatase (c-di-AMP/oligoRNAs hydrolase)
LVKTVVGNSNVILHRLLGDAGVSYRVLLTLNRIGGNQFMVSLRSSDGEALPVARQLQGGGHPNAAGAALPKSVQRVADAVEYLKKALNPIDDGNGPAGLNTEALFENVES